MGGITARDIARRIEEKREGRAGRLNGDRRLGEYRLTGLETSGASSGGHGRAEPLQNDPRPCSTFDDPHRSDRNDRRYGLFIKALACRNIHGGEIMK